MPTDPDPTAAELAPPQTRAECVAWLEARAAKYDELAEGSYYNVPTMVMYQSKACDMRSAAADLARGEQP